MKKKILLLLIACFLLLDNTSGQTQSNPEDLGTWSMPFSTSRDISAWEANDYIAYYRFTLTKALDITISHCRSTVKSTGIFLINKDYEVVASNVGNSDKCPEGHAYLSVSCLPAGTYTIMIDWPGNSHGNVVTQLIGEAPDITRIAKDLGDLISPYYYVDTKDTSDPSVAYQGKDIYQNGVCYCFFLTSPMDVVISNCGSEVSASHLYLLDQSGKHVAENNYYGGVDACDNPCLAYLEVPNLLPGLYYVVSKGEYVTGKLTTRITATTPGLEAGSDNRNYIVTRTYTDATAGTWRDKVDYFDGMGRPWQTVQTGASPTRGDLVTLTGYDRFGREQKVWLPTAIAGNNGAYVSPETLRARIPEAYGNDRNPHSLTEYELSPLDRPVCRYGAGEDWQSKGKAMRTQYQLTNIAGNDTLNCFHYKIRYGNEDNDTLMTVVNVGNYPSGSFTVTRSMDEDGNAVLEFKNSYDQMLLKRQILRNGTNRQLYDTYFIYDEWENLLAVLPPKASEEMKFSGSSSSSTWNNKMSSGLLYQYAYLYRYDERCRMTAKKLPGQNWVRYVYDKADTPIFSQDGNQRNRGEWSFSIPDALGRTCLTGSCKNSFPLAQTTLATPVKVVRDYAAGIYKGYSLSGVTLVVPQVLTVNYYDNYEFMGKNGIPDATDVDYQYESVSGYGELYADGAQSLLTGTLTAILDDCGVRTDTAGAPVYLFSVMYYDYRGRLIQTKKANHLSQGIEKEYSAYDFTDKLLKRKHIHSASGKSTQTEVYTYTYDHAGRLLTTKHKFNQGNALALADNQYNELGYLQSNKRNGNAKLKTDYTYNVRSWLKSISGTLFNQTLYYNDLRQSETNTACYGGNVSGMDWKSYGDGLLRGYDFTYDQLSRLTKAQYLQGNALKDWFSTSYSYDRNGNLLHLQRYGQTGSSSYGKIDNLTFTLNGNQLRKVTDAVSASAYNNGFDFKDGADAYVEYFYDANGNLTKDLNKKITNIQYNVLNLPCRIEFEDGSTISYLYGADGMKLQTTHVINGVTTCTDYCGSLVYEKGSAKTLLVEGGYISLSNGLYHHYLQDHQGNNRIIADQNGNVKEENHYYPFGGTFAGTTNIQPYKYNGKELDSKKGLNWYDYGARHYDAALGRWHVQDPLAEKYFSISPYGYCNNNPICNKDEEGKFINNIIGAFIGGGVDLGVQVIGNLATGKNAFYDIDWVSVGASALEGGLTSGLSAGKTLAVRATVTAGKNVINGIKDGESVVEIAKNTATDAITDMFFGKASDMTGKGVKGAIPKVEEKLTKAGSQTVLSNNKATELVKGLPGISDTKTARKIATAKNSVVDVSKTAGNLIQNVPENFTEFSLRTAKDIYDKSELQKKKK